MTSASRNSPRPPPAAVRFCSEPRQPNPAWSLLRHRAAWRTRIEGHSRSDRLFRLVGLKPAVNSEHFRGAPLMPLRGRALELETLQHALLGHCARFATVIGVSGPPGVGKSRLCFEFGEWCRKRQIKVLEARAQVHSRATPLVPVLEALRAFFRIEPDTDAETARTRIEQTLTMLALPVVEHLAPLADFLGCAETTSRIIDPTTRLYAVARQHRPDREGGMVADFGDDSSRICTGSTKLSQDFLEPAIGGSGRHQDPDGGDLPPDLVSAVAARLVSANLR